MLIKLPGNETVWREACTLGETVLKLVRSRQTESKEFQCLLRFFGRDKLAKLYQEEIAKIRSKEK